MRTVTFSTPQIQQAINKNFVALNTNIEGSDLAGESIKHHPDDEPGTCIRGNGQQNVQTIFLTPDLEVFHAATGYLDPEDLYEEMQFAAQLFSAMQNDPDTSAALVRQAHQVRLKEAGFPDSQINAANDVELMMSMMQGNPMSLATGQQGDSPAGVFDAMIRQQFLKDQRFSIERPLMSLRQLESDPGDLVGRGQTFFSSSSNSTGNGNR
ncbi:MAG: hypothetical protein ACR2NP_02460 [Pirellulaceae bacterium]